MTARLIAALTVLFFSAPAMADASIIITNQSSFDIHSLYLSPSSNPAWGPDQFAETVLSTGSTFTLTGITCDTYDVKLVDEDGDECTLNGIALCEDTEAWPLDDAALIGCQMFSE